MGINQTFTSEDHLILHSYMNVVDGIAAYLGESYELTLYSLEDYEHSVIKIVNGFHAGTTVGAPITDLTLFWLNKIENDPERKDSYEYFSKNKVGEPLKSSTIAIRGFGNRVIGLLCINLYLATPMMNFFSDFMPGMGNLFPTDGLPDHSTGTIKSELDSARNLVLNDKTIPTTQQNKEIIRILHARNIFEIKNSVEQIANELNISVNTVYFHLRNIAKQE